LFFSFLSDSLTEFRLDDDDDDDVALPLPPPEVLLLLFTPLAAFEGDLLLLLLLLLALLYGAPDVDFPDGLSPARTLRTASEVSVRVSTSLARACRNSLVFSGSWMAETQG
jgi:hypothetical protein